MVEERRYGEEEMSEIFARAASAGEESARLPAPADEQGLTLGELQDVGREVGLAPERIARAAAELDARSGALSRRSMLGSPVSVGRVVDLPREATDREWQFLVAELRQTFGAKGAVTSHAGVREWSNGNLHAVLEETEEGHRLRLGTRKGNAAEINLIGTVFLAMAVLMTVAMATTGKLASAFFMPALFGIGGAGALGWNLLHLPRWAEERERQMEHIGARARELLSEPPGD